MHWSLSHRADPKAKAFADRHYSRQKPDSPQFVPPGRCLVLVSEAAQAFWVTSWPYAEYVRHAWAGAFVCSAFRNEGPVLASTLVLDALSATRWRWPDIPALGMITFVDASKVRRKRDPGRCFRKAGFRPVGTTKGGLVALQMLPADFPPPRPPADVLL